MNFAYGTDQQLRELLVNFATKNKTAVLFNSQEPAPNDGIYNSAVFVNQQGRLIAQYDKIRLMPFGEYVPLPRWMPGANLITAIVGDFTPGTSFTLMPVGHARAGVFICIESAYPFIARTLHRRRRRRADQYFQRRLSRPDRRDAAASGECGFSRR